MEGSRSWNPRSLRIQSMMTKPRPTCSAAAHTTRKEATQKRFSFTSFDRSTAAMANGLDFSSLKFVANQKSRRCDPPMGRLLLLNRPDRASAVAEQYICIFFFENQNNIFSLSDLPFSTVRSDVYTPQSIETI